jgi:hypothetical protein
MPATRGARAILARRITTALTIAPDRRHPAPAAARDPRAALQAPRIPVRRLVRRHPVHHRPARTPVPRTPQAPRIAQGPVRRPDPVTVRRRNPLRLRIQAAGHPSKLVHPNFEQVSWPARIFHP